MTSAGCSYRQRQHLDEIHWVFLILEAVVAAAHREGQSFGGVPCRDAALVGLGPAGEQAWRLFDRLGRIGCLVLRLWIFQGEVGLPFLLLEGGGVVPTAS